MHKKIHVVVKSISLRVLRWVAVRNLPRGASRKSYIYFDFRIRYNGVNDRVILYDLELKSFLVYKSFNPSIDEEKCVARELSLAEKTDLFHWLKSRLPSKTQFLTITTVRDPAEFKLFARDVKDDWECSISSSDNPFHMQCGWLIDDFIKKINQVLAVP
jgi:hypothetical protein